MRNILLIILSLIICSCAKTDEAQCLAAKEESKYYLTKENCSKAYSVIEGACGNKDGEYISLVASAHGCSAGYSELDLFDLDIDNINSASLITSLASLSSSNEIEADSDKFIALQRAIQTILTSTSGNPSAMERINKFGTYKGTDLNFQTLFMLIVQTGKFFAYYGNADAGGVKGGGSLGNICIFDYENADARDWINSSSPGTGSCTAATVAQEGSDDLYTPVPDAKIKTRLCNGIILFNNLIDILGSVDLSSSTYGDLSQVKSAIDALYVTAVMAERLYGTNSISSVKDIRSQSVCEASDITDIEKYYSIFFESIYQ